MSLARGAESVQLCSSFWVTCGRRWMRRQATSALLRISAAADARRSSASFAIGQKLWLNAAELKVPSLRGTGRKLGPLYHGPFTVTEVPTDVTIIAAYLTASAADTLCSFVSKLKNWMSGETLINCAPADPPTALDAEDDVWGSKSSWTSAGGQQRGSTCPL